MLTVVTPATPPLRLTTVARATALLGNAPAQILIDQASSAIATYLRRPLAYETVIETFIRPLVPQDGIAGLPLTRYPVDATTIIVTSDIYVLDSTLYELDPSSGYLYKLDPTFGRRVPWWWSYRTTVQYAAGFTMPSDTPNATWTLPAEIERACCLIAQAFMRSTGSGARDPLLRMETAEGVGSWSYASSSAAGIGSLPSPEAEMLLAPYRKIFQG